jgi:hypothetical protein
MATRRTLPSDSDDKCYAILKTSVDRSERILAVYNFQSTPLKVKVDLMWVSTLGLMDLQTSETMMRENIYEPVQADLPPYGYRFYLVQPTNIEKGK